MDWNTGLHWFILVGAGLGIMACLWFFRQAQPPKKDHLDRLVQIALAAFLAIMLSNLLDWLLP